MIRAMLVSHLARLAGSRLTAASHRLHRPSHLIRALQGLRLAGLVLGTLALALQSAPGVRTDPELPSMAAYRATIATLGRASREGAASSLRHAEKSPRSAMVRLLFPQGVSLGAAERDLEDDSPSVAGPTVGDFGPPPAPVIDAAAVQYTRPWPTRYLMRPQLLIRL